MKDRTQDSTQRTQPQMSTNNCLEQEVRLKGQAGDYSEGRAVGSGMLLIFKNHGDVSTSDNRKS